MAISVEFFEDDNLESLKKQLNHYITELKIEGSDIKKINFNRIFVPDKKFGDVVNNAVMLVYYTEDDKQSTKSINKTKYLKG